MNDEDKEKLIDLKKAIENLEGVEVPFNVIKQNIQPLFKWLKEILK